jgi:hypothetical protein
MTNRQWLKQEINQWVDDGVITDEEGKELSARYKHAGPYPYREAFFFLAAVCILGGLFFLGAGLWNGLTQDQRFLLAMGPLLVSFLLMLAVVLVDKKIPDPDVMEPDYRGTSLSDEILGFGGVSDSDAFESVDKIGKKAGLMAKIASETRTVPAKTCLLLSGRRRLRFMGSAFLALSGWFRIHSSFLRICIRGLRSVRCCFF